MDCDVPFLQPHRVRLLVMEDRDVLRPLADGAGQLTVCVMIAFDGENRNAGLPQSRSLADEEETGCRIRPIAIPEIARDQDEGDVLVYCELNQIAEGLASGGSDELNWSSIKSKHIRPRRGLSRWMSAA
jgi:hypothetical protein